MKIELKKKHWIVLSIMLVASAAFRLIPHPLNFAPLAAMALLGSAYVKRSWLAWVLPVVVFWASDLVLNNFVYASYYDGFVFASNAFLYSAGAMLAIVLMGRLLLKKIKLGNLIIASVLASLIFFLISNFGVWASGILPYPKNMAGLLEAYVAGLPFLKGTMIGDLVFTGVLFGAWELIFGNLFNRKLSTQQS